MVLYTGRKNSDCIELGQYRLNNNVLLYGTLVDGLPVNVPVVPQISLFVRGEQAYFYDGCQLYHFEVTTADNLVTRQWQPIADFTGALDDGVSLYYFMSSYLISTTALVTINENVDLNIGPDDVTALVNLFTRRRNITVSAFSNLGFNATTDNEDETVVTVPVTTVLPNLSSSFIFYFYRNNRKIIYDYSITRVAELLIQPVTTTSILSCDGKDINFVNVNFRPRSEWIAGEIRDPTVSGTNWYLATLPDGTGAVYYYNVPLYAKYQVTINCIKQGDEQYLYAAASGSYSSGTNFYPLTIKDNGDGTITATGSTEFLGQNTEIRLSGTQYTNGGRYAFPTAGPVTMTVTVL